MSARTFTKPKIGRTYLYYTCVSGAANKPSTCPALKHHKAKEVEEQVWNKVSKLLKDPERLRAGLERMIEEERRGAHGDPGVEVEHWLEEISEASRKRARYQEMAADRDETFRRLFGEEFARAYEQQLSVLKRSRGGHS